MMSSYFFLNHFSYCIYYQETFMYVIIHHPVPLYITLNVLCAIVTNVFTYSLYLLRHHDVTDRSKTKRDEEDDIIFMNIVVPSLLYEKKEEVFHHHLTCLLIFIMYRRRIHLPKCNKKY